MKKGHRTISYLYEATEKNRIFAVALTVMEIILSLAGIGFAMAMRSALDGAANQDMTALRVGLVWMVMFVLARIGFRAISCRLNEKVRTSIENNLKSRLLRHLLHSDYTQTEAVHTGEWMNRLTSDTTVVAGGLTELLPNLFGMLVKLIGATVMIVVLIPQVAYFLIPTGLLVLLITWVLRGTMKRQHKAVQESDGFMRSFLQERLGNMMIVRAFRAEGIVEKEAEERMDIHKKARMQRNTVSNICNIGFSVLMNALYIGSFAYCGIGIVGGTITYGTLLAVIQLVGQIQTPFAGLSGIVPRYFAMTASAERLLEAEAFEKENGEETANPNTFASVDLDNVSFAYSDGNRQTVFTDISLQLHKGDYVALTGHSGGGKSTLFKLLLCLYKPTNGCVSVRYLDGSKTPLNVAHRLLFAYVPQGNEIMSGSIREIVTFASKEDTDIDRINHALKIACADTFVAELENGIDTVLGERGAGLSEGQMQRLAIARAIYANAPIILFDEATSALDAETESKVLANLKSMTDKTVLIVTHRPAALEICNRIVEVNEGEVKEL